ncbi:Myosin regulatory light chain 2 [Lepeophtheirus salmonis]|uniref:Myosin regulatory light chain 2 n=1 Tax=Lepeophtheirus salmonis TaxID=72036 RepID=A0A7R8CHE3_LEPSM|nr:Myosin regulatory light chain 2 [Lepeophtheirus salmonis]CAF2790561.1 Myosin regulatory light chain 2 [Lepeophtheirus salmonis]
MAKGSGSKKAKRSGSNIFALFSQKQIQEFKEAFGIMDTDKDGTISAGDLKAVFSSVGKSVSDGEKKMAGGTDEDDVILKSFDAFEINGKIDAEMFKHSLMTWGDKFTDSEINDAFGEFQIEGGQIDSAHLKGLMFEKTEEQTWLQRNIHFLDFIP